MPYDSKIHLLENNKGIYYYKLKTTCVYIKPASNLVAGEYSFQIKYHCGCDLEVVEDCSYRGVRRSANES
jgi:hypothetical protein